MCGCALNASLPMSRNGLSVARKRNSAAYLGHRLVADSRRANLATKDGWSPPGACRIDVSYFDFRSFQHCDCLTRITFSGMASLIIPYILVFGTNYIDVMSLILIRYITRPECRPKNILASQ